MTARSIEILSNLMILVADICQQAPENYQIAADILKVVTVLLVIINIFPKEAS
jgi:hypothetical protein